MLGKNTETRNDSEKLQHTSVVVAASKRVASGVSESAKAKAQNRTLIRAVLRGGARIENRRAVIEHEAAVG